MTGIWPPRQYDDPLPAATWQTLGRCNEVGGDETWFPPKGVSSRPAKLVCRRCEVRAECLEYALEHGERFGVWGGLSERERRRLIALRDRYEAAA
ncbi:WhiB family transcriptional regulator [Streptosporangium vulgare]|uniref:Transcriptional regulator WhiB n=1 Tax=Streptosporangium vulgare TaxID=46190 RepID=A0ABV5TPZ7_9ACTN